MTELPRFCPPGAFFHKSGNGDDFCWTGGKSH